MNIKKQHSIKPKIVVSIPGLSKPVFEGNREEYEAWKLTWEPTVEARERKEAQRVERFNKLNS